MNWSKVSAKKALGRTGCAWIVLVLSTSWTAGQTVNNVPKYTSTGTLTGSAITEVSGNVGIGTTGPNAKLEIQPAADGNTQLRLDQQNWPNGFGFTVKDNGSLYIDRAGTQIMTMGLDGKVGIGTGTTAPLSTLDVNGNIDYMTMTAGLGVDSGPNGSGYYYVGSLPNNGAGVVQHLEVEVLGGGWTYQGLTRWVCNAYGGNVKCTRLNDSYSPDMNDLVAYLDGNGNYDFYVSSNTSDGWSSYAVSAKLYDGSNYRTVNVVYTPSPGGSPVQIALAQGPTFVTSNGAVGIGTTNPGATLEVNGTAQVDGVLNVSTAGICFPANGTSPATCQTIPYTGVEPTNAATASALAATPTGCLTGYVATGIAANGNAICTQLPAPPPATNGWSSGGSSLSGGYWVEDPTGHIHEWGVQQLTSSTYDVTINFPQAFATTNVSVTTSQQEPPGGSGFLSIDPNTTSNVSFTVHQAYRTGMIISWQADGY